MSHLRVCWLGGSVNNLVTNTSSMSHTTTVHSHACNGKNARHISTKKSTTFVWCLGDLACWLNPMQVIFMGSLNHNASAGNTMIKIIHCIGATKEVTEVTSVGVFIKKKCLLVRWRVLFMISIPMPSLSWSVEAIKSLWWIPPAGWSGCPMMQTPANHFLLMHWLVA